MYKNIGGKIKGLAIAIFILQTVAIFFCGLAMIVMGVVYADILSLLVAFAGMCILPVFAWISTWLLYGFGELIAKACQIERNTRAPQPAVQRAPQPAAQHASPAVPQTQPHSEKAAQLDNLLEQGLITEEEYNQTVAKEDSEVAE